MSWNIQYLPEAKKDLTQLDKNIKVAVLSAVNKVSTNPLPYTEGGYGKPLGKKGQSDLTGFLKIKLLKYGIRVVYKLIRTDTEMLIVVIGARKDDLVYKLAAKRIEKHDL